MLHQSPYNKKSAFEFLRKFLAGIYLCALFFHQFDHISALLNPEFSASITPLQHYPLVWMQPIDKGIKNGDTHSSFPLKKAPETTPDCPTCTVFFLLGIALYTLGWIILPRVLSGGLFTKLDSYWSSSIGFDYFIHTALWIRGPPRPICS